MRMLADDYFHRCRHEPRSCKLRDHLIAGFSSRDHDVLSNALMWAAIWSDCPARTEGTRRPEASQRFLSVLNRRLLIAALRSCRHKRMLVVLKIRVRLGDRISVAALMRRIQRGPDRSRSFALSVLDEVKSPIATATLHRLASRSRSKETRLGAIVALVRRGDFSRVAVLEQELARHSFGEGARFPDRISAALLFAGSKKGAAVAQRILREGTEGDFHCFEFYWRNKYRRGMVVKDWRADVQLHIDQVMAR